MATGPPIDRDSGTAPFGAEDARRPNPLQGICVLLVDDDDGIREILQFCLEDMGARVVTAESADEALFLSPRVRPDIVLTDIAMPVHDGFWLLRRLRTLERTQQTRTPVVAMTALSALDPVSAAVRPSFDAWLEKPFDVAELVALVGRLARKRMAA